MREGGSEVMRKEVEGGEGERKEGKREENSLSILSTMMNFLPSSLFLL